MQTVTVSTSSTPGATWYLSTTGSDSNNGSTSGTAFATFSHALATMSGCDTLIVENGYYYDQINMEAVANLNGNTNGSGCYTVIEAATPFGVTVDSSQITPQPNATVFLYSASYVQIIGIKAAASPTCNENAISCAMPWMIAGSNHIKLQQTAGFNAPTVGNMDTYSIGPGSSYVLLEDSHAYGGGRYEMMAYQSDHVIFRRDVARFDYMNPQLFGGAQCAPFTNYDSQFTIFQNDIAIDSGTTTNWTGVVWGGLWSEHNDWAIDNPIKVEGMIVDNVQGTAAWQDAKQSGVHTFINDAVVNSQAGLMIGYLTGAGVAPPTTNISHMTIANITGSGSNAGNGSHGIGIEGVSPFTTYTSQTVENNIYQQAAVFGVSDWVNSNYNYYYQDATDFGATFYEEYTPVAGSNDVQGTNPQIKYITQEEPGTPVYGTASDGGNIGATILYEIGTTGTLWGDPGYDTITTTSLWPFPNEAVIKTDMAAWSVVDPNTGNTVQGARGFAASGNGLYGGPITLTSYIWEALGNSCPAGICQ